MVADVFITYYGVSFICPELEIGGLRKGTDPRLRLAERAGLDHVWEEDEGGAFLVIGAELGSLATEALATKAFSGDELAWMMRETEKRLAAVGLPSKPRLMMWIQSHSRPVEAMPNVLEIPALDGAEIVRLLEEGLRKREFVPSPGGFLRTTEHYFHCLDLDVDEDGDTFRVNIGAHPRTVPFALTDLKGHGARPDEATAEGCFFHGRLHPQPGQVHRRTAITEESWSRRVAAEDLAERFFARFDEAEGSVFMAFHRWPGALGDMRVADCDADRLPGRPTIRRGSEIEAAVFFARMNLILDRPDIAEEFARWGLTKRGIKLLGPLLQRLLDQAEQLRGSEAS